MELTDVLICPKTGNRLRFDDDDSVVHVQNSDLTYPVVDGIIDFCPEVRDKVSRAYDAFAPRYDAYITAGSSVGMIKKAYYHVVWGFSDATSFIDAFLSRLPSEFDGVLLDVPFGTGVFTSSLYAGFPNATIIGVDYSMGMLQEARKRLLEEGAGNVRLIRADVANLPVRDGAVDMVVSMAGLHAFADKQRAVAEMRRVAREQGELIACGYFKGARRVTDWFVKYLASRLGYFSPPFFHIDEIASDFEGFTIGRQEKVKSFAWFEAVKEGITISPEV